MTLLLKGIKANNLLSSITPLIFATGRRFRRSGGTVLNAVDGTFNRYRCCGHCQHKKILKCAEGVERQATLFATYEIVISSISMAMISTIPRFRMRLPNAEINLSPRGQRGRGQGVSSPRLSNLGHCLFCKWQVQNRPRSRTHWATFRWPSISGSSASA